MATTPIPPTGHDVTVESDHGWTVCCLHGELNVFRIAELRSTLLAHGNPDRIAIDLAQVTVIERHSLTMLFSHLRRLSDRGTRVAICGAVEPVARYLHVAGIRTHFEMCPNVADLASSTPLTRPAISLIAAPVGEPSIPTGADHPGAPPRRPVFPLALRRLLPRRRRWAAPDARPIGPLSLEGHGPAVHGEARPSGATTPPSTYRS